MLRELRIRNVAVVESLVVPFEPGLNVLTGETGAGKSILVDAILLVRGARAQTDVIRTGAEAATVEAVFDVRGVPDAPALLDEVGVAAADGEIVIRRELTRAGRHRAFVNDAAVTVGLLERLGDHLVEVHGQHEHQRLLQPAHQLDVLDRFAGAEAERARVAELLAEVQAVRDAVERMRAAERERAQREDALRFQVSELDAARIRPGEEEELRAERRRLQHAERFAAAIADVTAVLRDEPRAAVEQLGHAARVLRDVGRLDPAFTVPAEALETAGAHVEEALLAIRALRDRVDAEPGRLAVIDERLDVLSRLKRKYGDGEAEMLAFRARAAAELDRLARHDAVLAAEARRLAELELALRAAAGALGRARREGAARLGPLVQRELRALGMERARFEIDVEPLPSGEIAARGAERVEFRFCANPGEEPRPLARIASGGELARTMLALQVVVARREPVPTMIFDEVDAGIGGSMAGVVADKLATIAADRQVLCVTHLPPIAARAGHHLRVLKTVRAGRTRAGVSVLAGRERVEEVARMLGGDGASDTARRHARELLARAT